MAIPDSLITAVVVAIVLGLIKAIDWLLSKRSKDDKIVAELSELQVKQLEEVLDVSNELREAVKCIESGGALTKEQKHLIDEIHKMTEHLDELHSVYDSNHVPKWYVPADLVDRLMRIDSRLEMLSERQSENLEEIKTAQGALIQKISDLIASQNRMTDRVGDLIGALSKHRD